MLLLLSGQFYKFALYIAKVCASELHDRQHLSNDVSSMPACVVQLCNNDLVRPCTASKVIACGLL